MTNTVGLLSIKSMLRRDDIRLQSQYIDEQNTKCETILLTRTMLRAVVADVTDFVCRDEKVLRVARAVSLSISLHPT